MPPRPRAGTGVSLGSSPDGSSTVVLLGSSGREAEATRLATAYVEAGRNATARPATGAGFVVLDRTNRKVIAVAPPIGLSQLFWCQGSDSFSLASNPVLLESDSERTYSIRPEALFRYIYFHMVPGPSSALEGISKLDGGHTLTWNGTTARVERYWRPVFEDTPRMPEEAASRALREVLDDAVLESLGDRRHAGAFLSGGLDSSTVAGLAARHRPGLQTVSMGFDAKGYDEMHYARIASRHFGTQPLEYYVTPEDVVATLPMIAAAFPEPFGNSSAAAAYHCARVAREHGLELLLAGDGGDELFGGNERYATQLVFERYGLVPRALRRGLLEPLVGTAARVTTTFPIGKAQSYIRQANVPLPDRLQTYNFLHRHDPVEVFNPELLALVDQREPLRILRDEYATPDTASAVNRMLFLDWKFTLQDNDLVKVNTMCKLAGIEVAYPMLDPAVLDFSLRVPGDWKVRKGELRWFFKRAMRDFLPQQILDKTKHGFGLPFGVWTRSHDGLRKMSEDALASLAAREFFRPEFLRESVRLHREGHASYYGELVWILMVLEFWLQSHDPGARM